mgnify:CR=1 FL=1
MAPSREMEITPVESIPSLPDGPTAAPLLAMSHRAYCVVVGLAAAAIAVLLINRVELVPLVAATAGTLIVTN